MTEGSVDLPGCGLDNAGLVVSRPQLSDGVRGEHFERLPIVSFGLREVTMALFWRPTGLACVKKPLVSNTAQLNQAARPTDSIFFSVTVQAALIPSFRERKIPDSRSEETTSEFQS